MLKTLALSSVLYGALFSAVLALLSFLSLSWVANKSHLKFQGVLFGGMLLRLLISGAAVIWVWKYTTLDGTAFVVGLLAAYFVLQVIETIFLQRLLKRTRTARRA
ncbi:MAG: hypothetical protein AAB354_15225 [candidate division KSB1 bacterium]